MPEAFEEGSTLPAAVASPAWKPALAIASAGLVLTGIIFMQQTDTPPWLPVLPSGIIGEVFPNAQWVVYGSLCTLLGMLGAFFCMPGYQEPEHRAEASEAPEATSAARALPWAALLGTAGAILYLWAIVGAYKHSTGYLPLFCLIVSILLFGVCLRMLIGPIARDAESSWTPIDWLFVGAVLLAFIALNMQDTRDWHYAYWGDEWPFYTLARSIANGAIVDPFSQLGVYGIHPIADSIYQALVMRVAGIGVVGWHLSSTLATALPVIPLYAVARRIGGSLFAGTATILYATCPLLWAFSHIGYNNDDPLFLMIAAALFCYKGARAESPVLLFAAGACAGACWYSIFTGRLIIGVLSLFLLTYWAEGLRATMRRIAFLALGFVLVVAPLVIDNGLDTIRAMSHNTPISTMHDTSAYYHFLSQNAVRGFYAFLYSTANHHYTLGAIFNPLAAAALCIGVALALRSLDSLAARLLLIWFLLTSALTTTFNDAPEVSLTRSMVIVPPAALLAAWGTCAACQALTQLVSRSRQVLLTAASVAALGTSLGLSLHQFYVTVPANRYPPYPKVVLILRAILAMPNAVFVLPADMQSAEPNGFFCDVLDGFRIDPAVVLFPAQQSLRPYCPLHGPAPLPEPNVLLIQTTAGGCTVNPSIVLEEKQGSIWGYRFTVPIDPRQSYPNRLLSAAQHICPAL